MTHVFVVAVVCEVQRESAVYRTSILNFKDGDSISWAGGTLLSASRHNTEGGVVSAHLRHLHVGSYV